MHARFLSPDIIIVMLAGTMVLGGCLSQTPKEAVNSTEKWKQFESPKRLFTVEMPGDVVTVQSKMQNTDAGYFVIIGNVRFNIQHYRQPGLKQLERPAVQKLLQDSQEKAVSQTEGATLLNSHESVEDGLPVLLYQVSKKDDETEQVKMLVDGDMIFHLSVKGPSSEIKQASVSRFFDSFKLHGT